MIRPRNKNLEKFSVVRGGLYAQPDPRSIAERCKAKVQERMYALVIAAKGRKDRGLANVAGGVTNPTGEAIKTLWRMKRMRFSPAERWQTVIEPQIAAWHRMDGRQYTTGEYTPPHAA